MKFGNFVFPVSTNPANDQKIIDETLEEILFCEQLGYDTVWLSEHHFDGATAYVDPVTFAAAVAAKTKRIHRRLTQAPRQPLLVLGRVRHLVAAPSKAR